LYYLYVLTINSGVFNLLKVSLLGNNDIKKVHFVGIGGISMSGLAEILLHQGYKITGSDAKSSPIVKKLEKLGIKITIGHYPENVRDTDLVVYTAAVHSDNPELVAAAREGIPCIDRATLLGEIMKGYPGSIAVSGTHGKTTTTSMISLIMLEEGLDPTIHVGGELDAIGGTTRIGNSRYFITEACEYTGSFLKLHPYLAVILNIEYDHVDYFKNIEHIRETFLNFAKLIPEDGWLIACGDDASILEIAGKVSCNTATFSLFDQNCTWSARDIVFDDAGCAEYTLLHNKEPLIKIKLNVPGLHNAGNSLAAIAACCTMGANVETAARALLKFRGTHRRFEKKGIRHGVTIIDDYAHHPTEVTAALKTALKVNHSRIWCIFQPHTYTRTKILLEDFSQAFDYADIIIVTDIYAAREADSGEVNSQLLVEKIRQHGKNAIYIKDFESIVDYLAQNTREGDLVITMGAGDIYRVGELFLDIKEPLAVS